ncbi:MobV family relaxase [Streptococcus suis]|uniref:MobV family relaxase n=1 Tax=Streptococcus suis TaxID=1307 RepID=UPI000419EB5F|nr:MobV family relaxase [Streptococcus suis]
MSYIVARMQKMKAENLGGAYKHNERIFKNHSNEDIDVSRSHLNYELSNRDPNLSYEKQIKSYVNEQKFSRRAIRKDAVLCDEWLITSDKEFFGKLSEAETRIFFETAKNYFAENYGLYNVAYARVHLDESTPHMHLGIVPMKEGKLSSKAMFDKEELKKIQEELPKYMRQHGFVLERGEKNSTKKHLRTEEFKEKQRMLGQADKQLSQKKMDIEVAKGQLAQVNTVLVDRQENLNKYQRELDSLLTNVQKMRQVRRLSFEELQKHSFARKTLDGKIKMDIEAFDRLYATASQHLADSIKLNKVNTELHGNVRKLTVENNQLAKELLSNGQIQSQNNDLHRKISQLEMENRRLKTGLDRLLEQVKATNQKLSMWRRTAKKYMPTQDFRKAMQTINRIRPSRILIQTAVKAVQRIIEQNL